MKGQIVFIKLRQIERLRRRLYLRGDVAQIGNVFGRDAMVRPGAGQRLQFDAQAKDLLNSPALQPGDGRSFVEHLLHIALLFQLDQRLAHQGDVRAQLLCKIALDDGFARLDDAAQNRFFERRDNLIPFRDGLNQLASPTFYKALLFSV